MVDVLKGRYHVQRGCAKRRGVAWGITFGEWLGVWQESGKLPQRGRKSTEYCMARNGDVGPYAVGNVHICTNAENRAEVKRLRIHKSIHTRLSDYIESLGDVAFAKLIGVSRRAVTDWRLGARTPRPAAARRIVATSKGKLDMADIYGARSERTVYVTKNNGKRRA